jgi:putative ABC transport system substrate-binding protein
MPGDIPYTQTSKYELVINLKTARSPGLAISTTLSVQASEVIE